MLPEESRPHFLYPLIFYTDNCMFIKTICSFTSKKITMVIIGYVLHM